MVTVVTVTNADIGTQMLSVLTKTVKSLNVKKYILENANGKENMEDANF